MQAQNNIQVLVEHFFKTITSNPIWEEANDRGILSIPLAEDWENREFQTHIVPIWSRQRYNFWLMFHLTLAKYCVFPVEYPTVPKGKGRVRVTFHGINTKEQVEGLAAGICEWAEEMIQIEDSGVEKIPKAARQVYALMAEETNGI